MGSKMCHTCDGIGHLGPATGAAQRDYGRECPSCHGAGVTDPQVSSPATQPTETDS